MPDKLPVWTSLENLKGELDGYKENKKFDTNIDPNA
jgi:hypothetical protein